MAERVTLSIGKERVGGLAVAFAHPRTQSRNGVPAQRSRALLASFSRASNVGASSQGNVLATKSDQLGSTQPRLHRHQQQRSITTAHPSRLVGGRQESVDFGSSQKIDRFGLVALARNGQNPLRQGTETRLLESDILEKRVN